MASYNYLIRRRFWTVFGAKFDIFDAQGRQIGFSKQKAFKLKEDLRVFKEEASDAPFLEIHARNIIDFSAAYDVFNEAGVCIGTWKRKGMKSILRDTWIVEDSVGNEVGIVQEDSLTLALLRRFLFSGLIPKRYNLSLSDGRVVARYERCFNPIIFKQRTLIYADTSIPAMLILGGAILLSAIEGYQSFRDS